MGGGQCEKHEVSASLAVLSCSAMICKDPPHPSPAPGLAYLLVLQLCLQLLQHLLLLLELLALELLKLQPLLLLQLLHRSQASIVEGARCPPHRCTGTTRRG